MESNRSKQYSSHRSVEQHTTSLKYKAIKTFLTCTAIIEGLTGLALLFAPSTLALVLFKSPLSGSTGMILAMVGGAAIFSLAVSCWFARSVSSASLVKTMLFYNLAVAAVLLYGVWSLGFGGPALWVVIGFHVVMTVFSIRIILKTTAS